MRYWNFTVAENEAELRIDGDIVDDNWAWIYEWFGELCVSPNAFREELKSCEGKPLTVWIDSYGGDVFAAAGIYSALKEYPGRVQVKIDGKAMSAATVIAMAGDEILMSPTSIFMIHNPLTSAHGYASDLRKTADVLDTVKDTIINSYKIKTGLEREKISQLMDEEKYMSAQDAVQEGFVDGILYVEHPAVLNFGFSRSKIAILNSADGRIRELLEHANHAPSEPPADPDTDMPPDGDPIPPEPEQGNYSNILKYFDVIERN